MLTAIEKMESHATRIVSGNDPLVKPGQSARFTEACVPGYSIRQGDLYLDIVANVPDDFVLAEKPTAQLVPGNTQGSRHCLKSLDGVKVYLPREWNEESLVGPCLVISKESTVMHPTHGHVIIPAGFIVQCNYQREWSREEAKERRARD